MYPLQFTFLWLICLLLLLAPSRLSAYAFTNIDGSKIEAAVRKVEQDTVTIFVEDQGKEFEFSTSILNPQDLRYIQEWAKMQKAIARRTEKEKVSQTTADNFDDPWPALVSVDLDIEIEIAQENEEKKRYVYHSPNYEFICDVRLSKSVMKKFATLFEATREYCRVLPISTMKAHVPGAQFRNKVYLFEKKSTYIRNGGPPQSAGVFISRGGNGIVMVPLSSLGVKKLGSGYTVDYKGENKVLPHELVHQLTDREYYKPGARGWFSEGLADYVAVTPYRSGKYIVRNNISAIKDYATGQGRKGRGGRNLGEEISAPNLKRYMLQSYSDFLGNAGFNYGFALLLTTYYFHMEEDTTNITNFMKALKEGKHGEEALDVLLNGRSWEEMENQIAEAWRSKGVKIKFGRLAVQASTKVQ